MSEWTPRLKQLFAPLLNKAIIVLFYLGVMMLFFYSPLVLDYFGKNRSINVCAFTETFSPEAIERFEQSTGIKVNLTYVELDEQIYAKFKINDGEGYDVVNISDFMVQMLSKQDLLHHIDRTKIRNFDRVDTHLLQQAYDSENKYGVPHKWFMYGIMYDRDFFNMPSESMSFEFVFKDPEVLCKEGRVKAPYKICMIDSPVDAFFLAGLHLFKGQGFEDAQTQGAIEHLLIEQKKWVECYTLYSIEYFLLTGLVPIAITSSNFARKMWGMSDRFEFAIPQDGGILVIENLAIPKNSANTELAYQFIDFMISDEIAVLNSSVYGWVSSNKEAMSVASKDDKKGQLLPKDDLIKRLHIPLFSSGMRAKIEDIWLKVGFA